MITKEDLMSLLSRAYNEKAKAEGKIDLITYQLQIVAKREQEEIEK